MYLSQRRWFCSIFLSLFWWMATPKLQRKVTCVCVCARALIYVCIIWRMDGQIGRYEIHESVCVQVKIPPCVWAWNHLRLLLPISCRCERVTHTHVHTQCANMHMWEWERGRRMRSIRSGWNWRMATPLELRMRDVCWRMLTYAQWVKLCAVGETGVWQHRWSFVRVTYADVCWRMRSGWNWRMATSLERPSRGIIITLSFKLVYNAWSPHVFLSVCLSRYIIYLLCICLLYSYYIHIYI